MRAWIVAGLFAALVLPFTPALKAHAEDAVKPPVVPEKEPAPAKPVDNPTEPLPPVPVAEPEGAPSPEPGAGEDASEDSEDAQDAEPGEFPTPAELIRRMKEMRAKKEAMAKVAYFDLGQTIVEKPADFSLFGDSTAPTLRSLIERLHKARDDQQIKAVLVTIGQTSVNFAQAQEIRNALGEIRKAGKPVFVYADVYDTLGYTIATGASDVCLLAGGELMIPGVGMEAMFVKGLLDKVGVKADYVQIGEYKGADEQYTRVEPSEQMRGEMNKLLDALYGQIVEGIVAHRNLSKEAVEQMIDETMLTAEQAKERGFVDHLMDIDQLRPLLAEKIGQGKEVELVYNYGIPQAEPLDFSNPFALIASLAKKPEEPDAGKPAIGLIYAEGVIVDGPGGESLLGGAVVGSDDLRKAFRKAAKDDNIKAVVIRIDSPGGSALASEVMWQAARHVAAKKPVIISIGGMAASGGYYLASAGDYIYADPSAIVGSIGVVGGKFVTKDLFDKIGITGEEFNRGRNADLFSSNKPFDDRQRELVRKWMQRTYEQFTQRVMSTRGSKIKDIDQVARGRIFLAAHAKDLGMVDELGGVEDAIGYAAGKAQLQKGGYAVKVLPTPKTLADYLTGNPNQQEAASPEAAAALLRPQMRVAEDSILRALSPSMRRGVGQQLQMLQLLQDRPVVLVAPYTVTVK